MKGIIQGAIKATSKLTGTLGAKYIRTGRRITGKEDKEVRNWWHMEDYKRILTHPTCERFIMSLKDNTPEIKLSSMVFYRGRWIDSFHPTFNEMGPPPASKADFNRYNKHGTSVLYLCDSENGVLRELSSQEGLLWIQKFKITFSDLRIADFTSCKPDTLINAVMWYCELSGNEFNPPIIFSQTVAGIIQCRFDGMLVPGVRGYENEHYNNLVIFSPGDKWKNWILDEPYQFQ